MLDKLAIRTYEPYAQCLHCGATETIPLHNGLLDGRIQGEIRYYGKWKQIGRKVYHNCGDRWSPCELYSGFRRRVK